MPTSILDLQFALFSYSVREPILQLMVVFLIPLILLKILT